MCAGGAFSPGGGPRGVDVEAIGLSRVSPAIAVVLSLG